METTTEALTFIHRFLPGRSARTLLLLHGTGGNENDLLNLGRTLDPAAARLSPRGRVLERGSLPRFFRRLAEGVFDMQDLEQRTHELADFVSAAAERYDIDSQQITAAGYSNGANIAASTLLLRPGTLTGAVLFRPMVPLVPDMLPDLAGTRVLISAGQHDPIVAPAQSEQLALLLQSAGATVTLAWQPGGHSLSLQEVHSAGEWLRADD